MSSGRWRWLVVGGGRCCSLRLGGLGRRAHQSMLCWPAWPDTRRCARRCCWLQVWAPEAEHDEITAGLVALTDRIASDVRVAMDLLPVGDGVLLCRKL